MTSYGNFYKNKYFDVIKEDLTRFEVKMNVLQETVNNLSTSIVTIKESVNFHNEHEKYLAKKMDTINSRVNYIYAFAAGIAFIGSFVIDWIKDKFWGT